MILRNVRKNIRSRNLANTYTPIYSTVRSSRQAKNTIKLQENPAISVPNDYDDVDENVDFPNALQTRHLRESEARGAPVDVIERSDFVLVSGNNHGVRYQY